MTYPGSKLYYSTVAVPPDTWALESNVFKISLQDSMLDRSRLLTFAVSNPYNTVEVANRYFRYQRIQLFDRVSGIRIFLGRVERIEPKYSEDYGQYLEITCRDYIQEFFERTLNTNYTPAQKRSAIVSSIITNYRYGTIIQQDVEASGSDDLVTRNYTSTDIKAIEAIETLALEDKWDNTPTGYGYDYYADDEPRFWYFKRGTKPTSDASIGGMIISLGSPSQSPRVKHMLSDYIFPFNPLEIVTRVTVYGKSGAGATISATVTDAALEASLGIVKQIEITDVMIPYDTSAAAAAAGQAGNSCEDRADAIAAYYGGNVTRAIIKIVNYPVYSMAPVSNTASKLSETTLPAHNLILGSSFLGGSGWELLRAGHRVRVINSLKSIDEDFLVLGINYVEPESISELELISTARGRGVFGYAVSRIIADMRGKENMVNTYVLKN